MSWKNRRGWNSKFPSPRGGFQFQGKYRGGRGSRSVGNTPRRSTRGGYNRGDVSGSGGKKRFVSHKGFVSRERSDGKRPFDWKPVFPNYQLNDSEFSKKFPDEVRMELIEVNRESSKYEEKEEVKEFQCGGFCELKYVHSELFRGKKKNKLKRFNSVRTKMYFFAGVNWKVDFENKVHSKQLLKCLYEFDPYKQSFKELKFPGTNKMKPIWWNSLTLRSPIPKDKEEQKHYLVSYGGFEDCNFKKPQHFMFSVDLSSKDHFWRSELFRIGIKSPKIAGHCALYRKSEDKLIVYGGFLNSGSLIGRHQRNNFRVFVADFRKRSWKKSKYDQTFVPLGRAGHNMFWRNEKQQSFLIFGGYSHHFLLGKNRGSRVQYMNDVWEFTFGKNQGKRQKVNYKKTEALVVHEDNRRLDVSSEVAGYWKKIETKGKPPHPRRYASANIVGDKLFVYGGLAYQMYPSGFFDDLFYLDLKTACWRQLHILSSGFRYPRLFGAQMGVYVRREGERLQKRTYLVISHGNICFNSKNYTFKIDITELLLAHQSGEKKLKSLGKKRKY